MLSETQTESGKRLLLDLMRDQTDQSHFAKQSP